MANICPREGFKDMYKKDIAPDTADNLKAAQAQLKLVHPKKEGFVEMKKQNQRDFTKLLQGTEAYKNILRENQRAEYLKNLLNDKDWLY